MTSLGSEANIHRVRNPTLVHQLIKAREDGISELDELERCFFWVMVV